MVAYSFKPMFGPQVRGLIKRQTVRADRKRHARPGEAVQLYQGMRTRHCVKLVERDPICTRVRSIEIAVSDLMPGAIVSIAIEGIPLQREEIEAFCRADGFAPSYVRDFGLHGKTARENMGLFWLQHHGVGRFDGVLIEWEPA
ncbi:ASCH domain-containing protein [Mesorhizobium sp. M2A.F.Ca.ET.015.02.1.1]|uniref:ASCH domain-containing protein n=1 Tax=Mesorhizobium sp. M2A.F.Ca.ET.015.02.1.1 TaxID=2496758 RepID=UPI000FCA3847|nr:ASCH domain-containing protein [Mesorhizobium sp. M2A.F.Ca.ET.015.02.1.1]RUW41500.1 ASCH domain-containing protein [Mesorhizobium sp. M2A.F.Ca.ET.015.02.1.1]